MYTFLFFGVLTVAAFLGSRRDPWEVMWEVMDFLEAIWTTFLCVALAVALMLCLNADFQALASCPFWP